MIKIKKYQIEDYISDATQDALDLKADLVDGKVPASQLPSFVDDVIEVANYAALPIPGATGVIYITLDTNKVYRWTGSVYVEIASGVTNLSYTPGVSNGTVNSDTGTDATIPLAGAVNAGLFSAAEKSKLEGIAPNANVGVIPNAPITGATKTKITYDSKGLVTAGADATTADIADSTNKRYVTDANLTVISDTSGTNTGDQDLQQVTDIGASTTNPITALSFIKDGGFDFQFLKADGSVDNNTYLTSADLPSTLDLYATTSPDPVISGYTALVRNVTDTRYNTVAVDVPTPLVNGTIASPTFCGAVISDPSVLLGNPGVFNFTVIGNIRRVSGSTSSGADFFFSIYKRDLAGTEIFIADGAKVPVPANGGLYIEYISTALWNDGIFLSTDRIVLKFYGIQTGGGTGAYYEFLFGGADPVRGTASISSAIIPNLYLRDLADVEKTPALDNEILYWNDSASLWEHSLAENLVPLATATQKGLVSTTTQTFAGAKTFTGTITAGTVTVYSINDYGVSAISQNSDGVSGESNNGNGVVGVSTNFAGGVFMTTNGDNIAEFKTNFVLKAAVQNDGKITATAGTAGTDVVVKSQLDTKQNTITLSAIGSSPNANAATLTGSVLNLQPASASFGGVVTTGDQTFAGIKTFSTIKLGASSLLYEYFGTPFFTSGPGATLNIGGGPGGAQNNLAVPNGTFKIGLQTASTIASFDANKNVVSLPTATYPSLAELALVKGVSGSSIQTQLDGKVDENTAITGATKTKITYDSKGLVTAGADIATTDISDFNSATRAQVEAELVAGTNITITPSGTGATRQLTIAATGGGSSSQSAFTMLANNTSASAVPTEQVFKNIAQQVYTLTPVWTATAAPSGTTNHTYQWSQIGNTVTVRLNLIYSTVATGATIVVCPFPTDLPIPLSPSGLTSASANLYYGTGLMTNTNSSQPTTLPTFTSIRRNAANTGYELTMSRASNSAGFVYITIQYFTT